MLVRMSLRTTPLWFRMFLPFEPSPGNGPAVSAGIVVQSAGVEAANVDDEPTVDSTLVSEVASVAEPEDAVPADVGCGVPTEVDADFELLHAARAVAVANAPKAVKATRRVIVVSGSRLRVVLMDDEIRAGG
jgi:hypothetical protein